MRIKQNYEQKTAGRKHFLRGISAVIAAAMLWGTPFVSLADSTGTVTVESAKIRANADTNSDAVGSITKGKSVTIKDEVKDASGTLWYQVYVDANTLGFVRADLIDKEGGSSLALNSAEGGTDGAAASDASAGSGQGASAQAENAMDAQYATISVQVAKIRSGPSTNDSVVESLQSGTQLVVSGQSNGSSDGKTWYYVTFTGADSAEKTGYVRSDLVDLGDMVPPPEEEPAPEEEPVSEPQETVSQDYEVTFKNGAWYLINNVAGYEQELQPLLDAGKQQSETAEADTKKLVKQRIAIVVLGVLAAMLLIVVIIMAIKLRDAYYEDYEDDEDDEDDEEEDDEEEDTADEEEDMPIRRRGRAAESAVRESEQPPRRPVREAEVPPRRPVREREPRKEQDLSPRVRPAANRKSKNFLLDDDEFEFEFLNMDGKDL